METGDQITIYYSAEVVFLFASYNYESIINLMNNVIKTNLLTDCCDIFEIESSWIMLYGKYCA